MKKQLILGASLILGCMLTFTACKKDDPAIPLNPNNVSTINSLFQQLRSTPQIFTVVAGTYQTITGAKGTRISFHPQSFKDLAGNTINAGNIKIELTEMYKPGEMIANRVTTTTAAQRPLTSGGSVNIKASLNQHEIFANSYKMEFKQPAPSENPMAIFTGYQVTDATGTNVKWLDDTTGTVLRTVKDSMNQGSYYGFDSLTNFNWVNCDYFYSAPAPKTDITIVAPDNSYDLTNTQIFVIFPGINSVTSMYAYDAATHSFSFGYSNYHLPVGTSIKILILGGKSNTYYMDLKDNITVTNGMTINFTPATKTLSEIQTALTNL